MKNKQDLAQARTEFKKELKIAKIKARNKLAIRHTQIYNKAPIKYWQEARKLHDKGPKPKIDRSTLEEYYEKRKNSE